jgi:hypothetical protein
MNSLNLSKGSRYILRVRDASRGGHKMTNQWGKGKKDRSFTVTMDQVACLVPTVR